MKIKNRYLLEKVKERVKEQVKELDLGQVMVKDLEAMRGLVLDLSEKNNDLFEIFILISIPVDELHPKAFRPATAP